MNKTTLKKGKADYDAGKMTYAAKDYIEAQGVRLGYLDKMNDVCICELCQRAYEPEEINGVRKLKEFKGYTVDIRLKEFRRVKLGYDEVYKQATTEIEYISFDSPKGKKLLAQMHEEVTR
jgi:hypothetical protein